MPEKPISKQKLINYLRSAKVDAATADSEFRYLYITGRNNLVDVLLVSLYCGDFDE